MYKLSYEKCVCFIFLVILVFLSCSGFHTDRLVTLTDHNKKYPFTSSSSSLNENAQFDSEFVSRLTSMSSSSRQAQRAVQELEHVELWVLAPRHRRRRHTQPPPPVDAVGRPRPGRLRARRNRQQRRPPRFCPGQDVATRAYRAPIVVEGVVRSKKIPTNSSDYAVTVEVKKIHRNASAFRALNITDIIRLYFANRQHKGCVDKRVHGLVPAKLSNGEFYIFFLKSVGMHNYTVLGQPVPVPRDDKKYKQVEKQIQDIVVRKRVKPAKVVALRNPNTNIKLNDKVTLTCEVKGNPPPVITWYRNGSEIRRGKQEKTRIRHLEKKSNLVIQSFTSSDAGRYECKAKGVIGPAVSRSTNLAIPKDEFPSTEGSNCKSPQKEEYCLNGGTCVLFGSIGEVACRCSTGFNGQRCENKDVTSQTSTYPRSWTCTLGLSNSYYC